MLRPVPQANKRRGRHPDKAISAAFCRTVAESGRYADGNGLYLHVDPSGARRWVHRLVIRGRSRGLGLGSYALVSLAEARELARLDFSARNPVMSQRSLCSDLAPTVSLVAAWFLVVALWGLLVFAVALDALILGDGERVERNVPPTAGRSRGRRCVAGCERRPR